MLVLARKVNETIIINGDIRIKVVAIRGSQVRLGIEAPDSVGIFRQELLDLAGVSEVRGAPAAGRPLPAPALFDQSNPSGVRRRRAAGRSAER